MRCYCLVSGQQCNHAGGNHSRFTCSFQSVHYNKCDIMFTLQSTSFLLINTIYWATGQNRCVRIQDQTVDVSFLNSLIIQKKEEKKITSMKEVWIPGLN